MRHLNTQTAISFIESLQGRLDMNSEGLILLTNNGALARILELPANGFERKYRVRYSGEVVRLPSSSCTLHLKRVLGALLSVCCTVRLILQMSDSLIEQLRKGVSINGIDYGSIECKLEKRNSSGSNKWMEMTLKEGKNREIRRILGHFHLKISRIIRTQYGPYTLGDVPVGQTQEVCGQQFDLLRCVCPPCAFFVAFCLRFYICVCKAFISAGSYSSKTSSSSAKIAQEQRIVDRIDR
jgi:23S rRNA pseudouridine2605 synthase